jgi:hypothetical protein
MRTGLVVVGAAFSVIGAAIIVGILFPTNEPTTVRSSSTDAQGVDNGTWGAFVLSGYASRSATVAFNWSAVSANPRVPPAMTVALYAARPCPPQSSPCEVLPVLASWNGSVGRWSSSGGAQALYLLNVSANGAGNVSLRLSATLVEQYRATGPLLPTIPFAVTMVGAGLLLGVGSVAVYLGLFLPGGVYADLPDDLPPDDGPPDPAGWGPDAPGELPPRL